MGTMTRLQPVVLVCFAAALQCAGLQSMAATTWPELLMQAACEHRGLRFPSKDCDGDSASQDEASKRLAWVNLAVHIPNLFSVAGVSVLADAYGRRPALALSIAGQCVMPLCAACFSLSSDGGFYKLLGLTFVASWTGGWTGMFAMMMSVIADSSDGWSDRSRTLAFMILETTAVVGSTAGPLLGAKMSVLLGLRASFLVTAMLMAAPLLVVAVMPETLQTQKPWSWENANIIAQIRLFTQHRTLTCLGLANFFLTVSGVGSVNSLYLIKVKSWGTMQLAQLSSFGMAINFFGMLLGLPLYTFHAATFAVLNQLHVQVYQS